MPRRLTDAFEEEAYTSILEIPKYITSLRTSCTMTMGYLEERRALRAVDGKLGELDDTALSRLPLPCWVDYSDTPTDEVTDETILSRATDYGSFPNYESEFARPMQEILSLGPGPSVSHPSGFRNCACTDYEQNSRSHLALLAEQYFAVLSFKAPSAHKAVTPVVAASTDRIFVIESLHQLGVSFSKFLNDANGLTTHERILYSILSLLSTIIVESVQSTRSAPVAESLLGYISSVANSLDLLLDLSGGGIAAESSTNRIISTMSSLHGISCIRDAAVAAKLAAAYVTGFNDRQKDKDRSGASSLKKEVVTGIKTLDTTAKEALKEAGAWIEAAGRDAAQPVFVEKLKSLVTEADDVDGAEKRMERAVTKVLRAEGDGNVNIWVKKVADGWRQNLNGWDQVKWD
jgi:hypothetical protein